MKIPVKCFKYLTNRGNGKKCKTAPLENCRHQDCQFKKNGMLESSDIKTRIRYIYALAKKCREWHRQDDKHYLEVIKPQIDKICSSIK